MRAISRSSATADKSVLAFSQRYGALFCGAAIESAGLGLQLLLVCLIELCPFVLSNRPPKVALRPKYTLTFTPWKSSTDACQF